MALASDPQHDEILERVDVNRRRFVGRLIVGSAFAAPVVSSFSMGGVSSVFAQDTNVSGRPQVGAGGATPTTAPTSTTAGNTTTTTQGTTTTTAGNTTTTTTVSNATTTTVRRTTTTTTNTSNVFVPIN